MKENKKTEILGMPCKTEKQNKKKRKREGEENGHLTFFHQYLFYFPPRFLHVLNIAKCCIFINYTK